MKVAVVGAGFSGSVISNILALAGFKIEVFEERDHVGGNCYSERDKDTKILIHRYGPHIFHTDNKDVWDYVCQFTKMMPYTNRVKTTFKEKVYSLPINLHTINQFFEKALSPKEAKKYIEGISNNEIDVPNNFEEQALKFIGSELYEAFFKGYTIKQWGCSPKKLPASILKRLPVRFNYDDNYFNHEFQGMPVDGYTPIFEKLLDHENINVSLNNAFDKSKMSEFDHVFFTGPIDSWFDFREGRLGYRTLDFKKEIHKNDFQGCAVMNYSEEKIPYTRISEHKHFAPWEYHEDTVIFKEYSRECTQDDIPYYPIRLVEEKELLKKYVDLAEKEKKVSFVGRLATYRYLDMDKTIEEAMSAANQFIKLRNSNQKIPSFFENVL